MSKDIGNLINNIEFNSNIEAKENFEKVIYNKIMDQIQDHKKNLAKSIFNKQ